MENKKEIIIEAIKRADDRVSIMDATRAWYSCWKNKCSAESWAELNALQKGDRLDITWTVSKTGFKNIDSFMKVLRPEDEVPPSSAGGPPPSPGPVSPQVDPRNRDDIIAKQTCIKAGAEIVAAQIKAGVFEAEFAGPGDAAVTLAKTLFGSLKEAW